MGGCYELFEKLWAQFAQRAGPVNTEVSWTSDEILVGSVNFRNHFVSILLYIAVLLLVNHLNWNATPNSVTCGWLGYGSPILQFRFRGAWCDTVGIHINVVEGHFPPGCRARYRPFPQ